MHVKSLSVASGFEICQIYVIWVRSAGLPNLELKTFKVNKSRSKQCELTPHFSAGQNVLKKILTKDKYWHNQ